MATHDYVIANGTGAAVRSDLNNALAAIVSNNSGSSEPGTTYAYQWWADTNANVLKIRNSSNDGWITLRELDGTMLIEDGSASTPGLAFADDVNTGIFSGDADEIGFATGGAERLKISTSEAVFNDVSNDVDFRVESNGQTHMLFVDAGNDRIGIGTSSPSGLLQLSASSEPSLYFEDTGSSNTLSRIYKDGSSLHFNSRHTSAGQFVFNSENSGGTATERARIDSSGRLLVGATSPIFDNTNAKVQVAADQGGTLAIGRSDTSVTSGNGIGLIRFYGNDDSGYEECARIAANADGTHANGDKPTRLEFLTTADGESSPTEQIRIKSNGHIIFKQQASSSPYPEQQLKWSNDDSTSNGFFISQDSDRNGKIFHEQGLDILFGTSNTERMRLNLSGMLQVGGSTSADSSNKLEVTSTSGGAIGFLRNDTSTVQGDPIGAIGFYGNDSNGTYQDAARIEVNADADHATGDKPAKIEFKVSPVGGNTPIQRYIIESDGEQRMFSGNSTYTLVLNNGASAGTSYLFLEGRHSATSNTGQTGTRSLSITTNGNIFNTNNSYGQISDVKLKENIINASSQWDDIKGVQVRNFNFKEETGHPTHTQIGVVAQELETVSPGLVYDTPDIDADGNDLGTVTKTVNYSVLYMKAVKALQEAIDRIETLETKVAALEAG